LSPLPGHLFGLMSVSDIPTHMDGGMQSPFCNKKKYSLFANCKGAFAQNISGVLQ